MLPPAAKIDFGIHKAWIIAKIRLQSQIVLIFEIAQIGLKPMPKDASR